MPVKAKVLYEKMIADFRRLKPPTDEQTDADRILAISEEQLGMLDQMIAALKRNDTAYLQKLGNKGEVMDKESNRVFRRLGITAYN